MLESSTIVSLLLCALNRVNLQEVFDPDPYESRREALPGARLVKVLVVYPFFVENPFQQLFLSLRYKP